MKLLIPEQIILEAYQKAIAFVRKDYKTNIADPTQSYLGLLLSSTDSVDRYKFFEQAKAIFITTENDPRHLTANLFFNAAKASIPTIHITNPSEVPIHNTIGIAEGYQDFLFDEDNQKYKKVFNRRFKAKYNIVFTSDNTNEVILIYQIMKSLTISIIDHLQLSGLHNVLLSGTDINLKSDIIPTNVFIKSIGLEFEYDTIGIQLSTEDFSLGEFIPTNTPILD